MKKWLMFIICMTILGGCASQKTATAPLIRLSPSEYPAFADDMNWQGLTESIGQSLRYLRKIPGDRKFSFGADVYDAAHMIRSLEDFLVFIEK
ncbi:MAG: murein transglycosylase, partial [Desulfobacterales bacterium]